jgi:beta-glucanase (GH16 family)
VLKNRLLFTGVLLTLAISTARAEYELVWAEEFDAASVDPANWTCPVHHGVVRTAGDVAFYTDRPANVRVENGQLVLVAQREAYDLAAFTSGRLHTYDQRAFTYGRVEMRVQAPSQSGLRPQARLLPVALTYGSWPASGGIDIFEVVDGVRSSGLHFGGSGPRGVQVANPLDEKNQDKPGDGFHVYAVEWQPYEIRWFIDNALVAVQNRWWSAEAPYPAPFDRPFYLALGLYVEDPGAAQLPEPAYAMRIDWIRVYQAQGNRAPLVKLTDPAPDAQLPAAKETVIRADASDPDGNLAAVEFYSGAKRLAVDRAAPFEFLWSPPDGCYRVAARALDADGFARADSVKVTVGRGCPPTPFHGSPAAIPGRIEAEDFDESQKGEAYFDTDASNNGGAYRPDSGVDIQPCSEGGFNLGWMIDGEWTRYTVKVAAAGKYDVRCRVGSPRDTARIHLEVDGKPITDSLAIPNTGEWQNYTDVVVRGVPLPAGEQVLRLVVDREGLNLDYIEFTPSGGE